jgi:hypothetical protein
MGGGASRERTPAAASWDAVLWKLQKQAAEAKDKASLANTDPNIRDKPLPKGWVLVYSKVYRTHFYYNREMKTSSWTEPEDDDKSALDDNLERLSKSPRASADSDEIQSPKRPTNALMESFRKKTAAFKSKGVLPDVLAMVLRDAALEQEPLMTALMVDIAHEFKGQLEGLDFRLKSPNSLRQKVKRDVREANLKLLEDIEQRRVEKYLRQQRNQALLNSPVESDHLESPLNVKFSSCSSMQGVELGAFDDMSGKAALSDPEELVSPSSLPLTPLNRTAQSDGYLDEIVPQSQSTPRGGAPGIRTVYSSNPNETRSTLSQKAKVFNVEFTSERDLKQGQADGQAKENALVSTTEEDLVVDLEGVVWAVSDVLRYTIVFETSQYTQSVENTRAKLLGKDIVPAKQKNYWGPGDAYQGINDVFSMPCGKSPTGYLLVEVQFHTPESFRHKMKAHEMYEEFRQTIDPELKTALWRDSCAAADRLPVPPNVLELPSLCSQPAPITTDLYVDLVLERAMKIQDDAALFLNEVADQTKLALSNIKGAPAEIDSLGKEEVNQSSAVKKNLSLIDQWMHLIEATIETIVAIEPVSVVKRLMSPSVVEQHIKHELHHLQRVRESTGNLDDEDGSDLKDACLAVKDALILSVVIADDQYAATVALMLEQLSSTKSAAIKSRGFNIVKIENDWASPVEFAGNGVTGGFGIRCEATMEGEDDGVAFTPDDAYPLSIQFHTPQSYFGALSLKSAWSQYRSANTVKQRKQAKRAAHDISARVKIPKGASILLNLKDLQLPGKDPLESQ